MLRSMTGFGRAEGVANERKITVEVRRELFGSAAWREERTTVVGGGEQQRLGGANGDVMVM